VNEYILCIKNLTVKYHNHEALIDVTFEVNAGDYLGVVGPNGSGKTTLVKAILGLVKSSSGTISICNKLSRNNFIWDKIGYLPQMTKSSNRSFPATVEEIVGSGLLSKKRFPKRVTKSDSAEIKEILKLLQIEDLKKKQFGLLSGGQQQRVFLARALVSSPDILMLDEPTAALDPMTRNNFYKLLKELNVNKGITIILITHDSGSIGKYASKLLYLNRRVIFYGTFDDFCISPEMTDYFGEYSQHLICHRHG
jgi:zinc transport system ATP-binding protein